MTVCSGRGRRLAGLLAMVGSFALAGTPALAQTPAGDASQTTADVHTIHACYLSSTGLLYLIGLPDTPKECRGGGGSHVPFTWMNGLPGNAHGALNGLEADDHPQYLLVDPAGRALVANLNAAGFRIVGLAPAGGPGEAVTYEQAVKAGDGAGGDLGGTYPEPVVLKLQGRPVSDAEPLAGQVLSWNGAEGRWEPASPAAAGGAHGDLAGLTDDDHTQYLLANGERSTTDGFAVTGTLGNGSIPVEGAGVRMMWYPGKAAFRAGQATGSAWDDANVGPASFAGGSNNIASSQGSAAFGRNNQVLSADGAAFGIANKVTSTGGFAIGATNNVNGLNAFAGGQNATASENVSFAFGASTRAEHVGTVAMGVNTRAEGRFSVALGNQAHAKAAFSVALGSNNVAAGDPETWVDTDPLFVVGNGRIASTASNALTLYKNGNMTIAGTLTQSSDIRLKEDVHELGAGVLERVLELRPIRYRFRAGTGHPEDARLGLSAQDVQALFPELVLQDPATGYLSVAYADLSAVLVAAVQEQQRLIDELTAGQASLRDRLATLEMALDQLLSR